MSLATTPGEAHMPFRRSCDRCHDQKVRCMRSQESNHPVPDSEPCVRCKRSGSICIFSPQQKPGRPPLGSDTRETTSSAMYSRKRPRQSISLGSVDLPQSPPPTCPSSVTSLPDSAPIVGSLDLSSTLFSPFTAVDELGDGSYDADFLMSIPTMSTTDSLSSRKHNKPVCERNATNPIVDMIERDTEELGNLCLQVCHATRALSSSYPTSLAVSSPSLNEIFASTEALVSIIHRNTSSGSNSNKDDLFSNADPAGFSHQPDWDEFNWLQGPNNRWALPQVSPTVNRAPDTGVVLMILACHQRLLVTLGGILFYISRHLCQQKPRGLPIGTSPFIEMPTTQALIIMNLVRHQLDRLDRAVGLLAKDSETIKRQSGSSAQTIATGALSPLSPEQFHSPQSEEQSSQSKPKTAANDGDKRGISPSIDSSSSGSHKAITSAIDMMIYRQEQLQNQMKVVKQQIMSFDSI
ncbi:hypothetical protein CFAM422_012345 [Trichoderma lentiforme]|uniref:Zn(2)-C6 fungal-type domain-containing protein n=1 Tax=Trichoderma lentiforme TaxID=1567552 RepID=A0A9P4X2H5_9HYPO|nr:hypothetical protein CFAM422_012345 [Trichoderma lentiforme]